MLHLWNDGRRDRSSCWFPAPRVCAIFVLIALPSPGDLSLLAYAQPIIITTVNPQTSGSLITFDRHTLY